MKQIEEKIAEAQRQHDAKAAKGAARRRRRPKALVAVPDPAPINGHDSDVEEPNGPPEEPNGPPEEPNGPPEEPNGPPEQEPEPAARVIGLKVPHDVREKLEQIKAARGLRTIKQTALLALAKGVEALLQ